MGQPKHAPPFIERYFQLSKNHTTVRTEVVAGLTTFITMAYILLLNPQIMSDPYRIMGQPEMAAQISNGVFIATCFGAAIGTFLMAFYAKMPFAQAPGMGLNAFFAYTVVLTMGYSYSEALVVVFLSGLFFIFITLIGLREAIVRSIPDSVKAAITPGIGLFIAIIGLKNSGIVVGNDATLVSMVDFAQWQVPGADLKLIAGAFVALVGFLIIGVLHIFKVKGSILIGILSATVISLPFGLTSLQNIDFNLAAKFSDFFEVSFLQLDFAGLFAGENLPRTLLTVAMLVLSFSLVNMFDSIGTLMGAAQQSGLVDQNGDALNLNKALMSDACATATGALLGTSTVTTMVESSAGIAAGGRTGLTSAVTGSLFVLSVLFAPFVQVIPAAATAPALLFVAVLMLGNIKKVDFSDLSQAIPAFCTIVFMPLTYSIANGIAMGLISYCCIKLFTGKYKEINLITLAVALIFVLRYAFMPLG